MSLTARSISRAGATGVGPADRGPHGSPALSERLSGAAYRCAAYLAGVLPRAWAIRLGGRGGELAWAFQGRRRRTLASNWRAFTARAEASVPSPRRTFRRFGEELVETLRLLHAPEAEIRGRVHFVGLPPATRAAAGRGLLVLCLHSGNWEWAGAALALRRVRVRALARRHAGPVERVFEAARRRFGVEPVARARDASAGAGYIACFLDRQGPAAPASLPRLARRALALAARRGWSVAPCWTERQGDGSYRVTFGEPFVPPRFAAERRAAAHAVLDYLRTRAARTPEQWFAFERLSYHSVGETR